MKIKAASTLLIVTLSLAASQCAGSSFLYNNGVYTPIQFPGFAPDETAALGINNAGQVVGSAGIIGFVETNGVFKTVQVPGSFSTFATAINDKGQIAGNYCATAGCATGGGFLDTNGVFSYFDTGYYLHVSGINNAGVIAGYYSAGPTYAGLGYLYSHGVFTTVTYPGSIDTVLSGINNSGISVGVYRNSQYPTYGFTYRAGTFNSLQFPFALASNLTINDRSDLGGSYYNSAGAVEGFVEQNGKFTTLTYPKSPGTLVYGLNDSGEAIGVYLSTPEPVSLLMLLLGLSAIALLRPGFRTGPS